MTQNPALTRNEDRVGDLQNYKLEPSQRDLLMAAYQPQARVQKVAAHSGRSVPGFYQWLYRMRRLLLDCVQRELAVEEAR